MAGTPGRAQAGEASGGFRDDTGHTTAQEIKCTLEFFSSITMLDLIAAGAMMASAVAVGRPGEGIAADSDGTRKLMSIIITEHIVVDMSANAARLRVQVVASFLTSVKVDVHRLERNTTKVSCNIIATMRKRERSRADAGMNLVTEEVTPVISRYGTEERQTENEAERDTFEHDVWRDLRER